MYALVQLLPAVIGSPTHNILCIKDISSLGGGVDFDIGPYYVRWTTNATDAYQHISFVDNLPYSIISHVQQVNSVRKHIHTSDKLAYTHARLGHIGASKLKQLQALGHLRASDQSSEHGFDCEV
jgi:hypothetical protein